MAPFSDAALVRLAPWIVVGSQPPLVYGYLVGIDRWSVSCASWADALGFAMIPMEKGAAGCDGSMNARVESDPQVQDKRRGVDLDDAVLKAQDFRSLHPPRKHAADSLFDAWRAFNASTNRGKQNLSSSLRLPGRCLWKAIRS